VIRARGDLRQLYAETQAGFRRAGVTSLLLYRGVSSAKDSRSAVESWTSNPEIAKQYAGKDGTVLKRDVPVSQILTHHQHGRWVDGLFGEQDEYLVMW
jgi:hypothetical protein